MSTFDNKSKALTTTGPAASTPGEVPLQFGDVLKAVDEAPGLTHGVRQNLRAAVIRTAERMSPLGSHGPVDVPAIGKKLAGLAPAQLGFKTDGALSAYKSNLRRALRIAGLKVMPG